MGLDAEIYFRSKTEPHLELPGFQVKPVGVYRGEELPDATHAIDCECRYFAVGSSEEYRHYWPRLAGALMELLASDDVETMWYGNDCYPVNEINAAGVLAICEYYMTKGWERLGEQFNHEPQPIQKP